MHPYDVLTNQAAVTGSKSEYLEYINKHYLHVCEKSRVLELGPAPGDHSKLIIKNNPSYLELIEGDSRTIDNLKLINGVNHVLCDDIMIALQSPKNFDVVVCFGVLYHLHSPLHLLELIVNNCSPKHILLDSVHAAHPMVFAYEEPNVCGNVQYRPDWKGSSMNFVIPFFIINWALSNMGYALIKADNLNIDLFTKSNSWIGLWQQQETQ